MGRSRSRSRRSLHHDHVFKNEKSPWFSFHIHSTALGLGQTCSYCYCWGFPCFKLDFSFLGLSKNPAAERWEELGKSVSSARRGTMPIPHFEFQFCFSYEAAAPLKCFCFCSLSFQNKASSSDRMIVCMWLLLILWSCVSDSHKIKIGYMVFTCCSTSI